MSTPASRSDPGPRCLPFVAAAALVLLAGCGDSSAPDAPAAQTPAPLSQAECLATTAPARMADAAVVPGAEQVRGWQEQIDQYDGGFRPTGSTAEKGYIDQLAAQLRAMGAVDVQLEPYQFPQWSTDAPQLSLLQGALASPMPVAAYMPYSGSTGAAGVQGPLTYLPALSAANLSGALLDLEQSQDPADVLGQLLNRLGDLVGSLATGTVPLTQFLLAHNLKGQVVMYDLPRLTIPIGVFEALSQYVNNSGGTMGPLTPYSRPFIDMIFVNGINKALKQAGAVAAIGVIDYPPAAADGSYYPFFGLAANQTIPGVYVDRDTGTALKQALAKAGTMPVQARLTLDAQQANATSYNLSAVIPGRCAYQVLVSSHVDGTNSIEDNGPAAILAIASYFLRQPPPQRLRGLRIVLTSGHFVGSAGIHAYIAAHQQDLKAQVLGAIEIEHLGAREWLELSPGAMALDGLPEPQVMLVKPGTPLAQEAQVFARQFDRSLMMPPVLPVGEGQAWSSSAGLPLLAFITGPVYLLNGDRPEVSSQYTDYSLMQRQVTAFIQMLHDLDTQKISALRPDLQ